MNSKASPNIVLHCFNSSHPLTPSKPSSVGTRGATVSFDNNQDIAINSAGLVHKGDVINVTPHFVHIAATYSRCASVHWGCAISM